MSFVMACAEQGDSRQLQFADVIVHDTRWTGPIAADLAELTLRLLPGCTLVVVGLINGGCLLRCRFGGTAVVQSTAESTSELFKLAASVYSMLVLAASATRGGAGRDLPLADRHCRRRSGTPVHGIGLPG
jgi:hypothetical protein